MNKIIIVISCFFCVLSCSKDVNNSSGIIINIQDAINFVPSIYFSNPNIIYKNEFGEKKIISATSIENLIIEYSNPKYKTEQFEVTLYDKDDSRFKIVLIGSGNLFESTELVTLVTMLMPFNPSGSTTTTFRFHDSTPSLIPGVLFHSEMNLYGSDFKDVYQSFGMNGNIQYDSFSEVLYNKTIGIIGFRDESNQLWVFDSFES